MPRLETLQNKFLIFDPLVQYSQDLFAKIIIIIIDIRKHRWVPRYLLPTLGQLQCLHDTPGDAPALLLILIITKQIGFNMLGHFLGLFTLLLYHISYLDPFQTDLFLEHLRIPGDEHPVLHE
jgi:hypothetical protein